MGQVDAHAARLYLRVGEPIACGPLVDAHGDRPAFSQRPDAERREVVRAVGERILHRIGAATVALPTGVVAMALLAVPRRGVRHAELVDRAHRLRVLLISLGCAPSPAFDAPEEAVAQALSRFVDDGHVEPLGTPAERVWSVIRSICVAWISRAWAW